MLRQHQASLDDRKKFTALVKDLFPDQAKNVNLLLMAYNMGADGAETLWNKGIYTTPYVDDILTYQAEFNKQIEERNGDQ